MNSSRDLNRLGVGEDFSRWYNTACQGIDYSQIDSLAAKWEEDCVGPDGGKFNAYDAKDAVFRVYRDIYKFKDIPKVEIVESPYQAAKFLVEMYMRTDQVSRMTFSDFHINLEPLKYFMCYANGIFLSRGSGPFSRMSKMARAMSSLIYKSFELRGGMLPSGQDRALPIVLDSIFFDLASYCLLDFLTQRYPGSPYRALVDLSRLSNWHILYANRAIICRNPTWIHEEVKKGIEPRHADDPLISWADRFGIFMRNGVMIPHEFLTVAPDEIDPAVVLQINNVDLRRELVRIITPARLIEKTGGTVLDPGDPDDPNGYQVVSLDLNDGKRRYYLRMNNLSVKGAVHFEGVPGRCSVCDEDIERACPFIPGRAPRGADTWHADLGCNMVRKALYFRNATLEAPRTIT